MRLTKNIILKYQHMSLPVKASFWFVICSSIQKGIAIATTPVFTRILTTSEYGQYAVYQSWYSLIATFATLNLHAGVFNNGLLKYDTDKNSYQSALLGLSLTITSILFILYIFLPGFWNSIFNMSPILVVSMFLDSFFSVGILFWSTRQRFDYKYQTLIYVTLISAILAPIIGIIAVLNIPSHKVEARVLSFIIVNMIVGGYLIINSFCKGKCFFNKKYWSYALKFNLPLIPHYLSTMILNQADRIMIEKMVGSKEAGIYSVAYSSAMIMTILSQSINNSFVPWTYKTMKTQNYYELKKVTNLLISLIGLLCFIMMLLAPEIICFLAGKEYYAAVHVIPPVAGAVFFMFLFPLFSNIEFYFENTKFIMVASSTAAILNLIINYFAIRFYGYIAAGYTTLGCYIILCLMHYIFMKRVCFQKGIKASLYDMKFIVSLSFCYTLTIIFIAIIYPYQLIRYAIILLLIGMGIINKKKISTVLNFNKN